MRGQIYMRQPQPDAEPGEQRQPDVHQTQAEVRQKPNYRTSKPELPGSEAQRQAASAPQGQAERTMPVKNGPRIGRNDPCPCGSGKKYKNCHGRGL